MASRNTDKGTYLELRVARLLLAQGLTPFVNVWYRSGLDLNSILYPDVDVMGCRFLPDCTIFFAHYDCKSGESNVINRVLLLAGLRAFLPPGPIVYVRKRTSLDIKRYAMQYGVKIADIAQIEKKEEEFVKPIFGENFPSICDEQIHKLWLSSQRQHKNEQIGRILRYLDYEFWGEPPFTRLRRSLAAVQLVRSCCTQAGITDLEKDLVTALVIRRFLFALVSAASHVSMLSEAEMVEFIKEALVTEKLPPPEYHTLIESAAQMIFDVYGDPAKGPLRREDYYVPPPDYTEELLGLLKRTIALHHTLSAAIVGFDAVIIEHGIRNRQGVGDAILGLFSKKQRAELQHWLISVKLFLCQRVDTLTDWVGWRLIR